MSAIWQDLGGGCFVLPSSATRALVNIGLVEGSRRALVVDTGCGPRHAAWILTAAAAVMVATGESQRRFVTGPEPDMAEGGAPGTDIVLPTHLVGDETVVLDLGGWRRGCSRWAAGIAAGISWSVRPAFCLPAT